MLRLSGSRSLKRFLGNTVIQRSWSFGTEWSLTPEQENKVVTLLNSATDLELRQYVGVKSLRRLSRYRGEHGDFKSFNELFSVEGLGPNAVMSLTKKILVLNDKLGALAENIVPALSGERVSSIRNVTSFSFNPPYMTYVKMDRDRRIYEWQSRKYLDDSVKPPKPTLNDQYQLASTIYPQLPLSDIFIMDAASDRPDVVPNFEKHLLRTILYTMLSFGERDQPKVVQFKPRSIATFYDLQMGSDRVSCQEVFEEFTKNHQIKLSEELAENYKKSYGVGRELLGVNALHCLAFVEVLCMLEPRKGWR